MQDNKNNKGNKKQWEALTTPHSSYSKFPQCDHPRQPGDKRASVSLLLKATSQQSRLQQAQIWLPTGSSCHSRARSIPALSLRLAPSLVALSHTPVGWCAEMQLMPTSKIPKWNTAPCPWLLRADVASAADWFYMHDRGLKRLLEDTSIFRNKCAIIAQRSDALSNETVHLVLIQMPLTMRWQDLPLHFTFRVGIT